ncbi:MAG: rod shape-determining protein MreD [Euzebya sp.]
MGIRAAAFGGLILLAILLKTTVLPAFAINSFRPDVLVVVVVGVALIEGPDTGIRLGFAAGLVQDLLSGGAALVGLGALVMMTVGYTTGLLRPYILTGERSASIALSGIMAAATTGLFGLLGRMFGVIQPSLARIAVAALVVGLYSAAVSPLVLRPTQWLIRQFPAGVGS